MVFRKVEIEGAYLIEPEARTDERGLFARTWCAEEYRAHGLKMRIAQCSTSFNFNKGTLRGLHYQVAPYQEAKVVRCTRGAVYDVMVDLRPHSASFKQYVGAELSADNRSMLYVPEGCAHGFLTLAENTEVFYQMNEFWAPDYARGVRWNDPAFGIRWPAGPQVIAERDSSYPDFVA